jgi:ADP-ribose pyrophosphatase YjhB (NUDIX family)
MADIVDPQNCPPRWLEWAREIQALAQTGYHYANNDYQRQRYDRLMEIAAEIINGHSTLQPEPLAQVFHAQTGYATPRVDVRAAVFQVGVEQSIHKLLLVRERSDGGWTLPGGWADVGDVPSLAAEREVCEEAGFHVKARRVVGVYDANRVLPLELFHAYKIVFLCDLIGGEATPSNETSEVGFFGLDELPQPLSGERTRLQQIHDAFAMLINPNMPTVFD